MVPKILRQTVEDCRERIAAAALIKACRAAAPDLWRHWEQTGEGALFPPVMFGKVTVRASLTGTLGRVQLSSPDAEQTLELIAQPALGRLRWVWLCPISNCTCTILYRPAGVAGFASRKASGLTYAVLHETRRAQAARRAKRIRLALGEVRPVLGGRLPDPPPRMTARVYSRKCALIRAAEARCGLHMGDTLETL